MTNVETKFNSLTPNVLEDNEPIYNDAINYALNNDDIKNIAITGIYGAGKSTVWKTYVNNNNLSNIINVSLGKYEDLCNSASKTDSNNNENISDNQYHNRMERQLINQISSQIKISKIPLSKYKFKKNKSTIFITVQIILTILFVSSILLWIFKEPIIMLGAKHLKSLNTFLITLYCGLAFIIPISVYLYYFFTENRFRLSKINLKGAEANFKDDTSDETILDRDIKELVYLLSSSKTDLVVFEDLDRYDNIEIFTKLRELNFLLNSYVNTNENNKNIKFIYMLKDSLFFSKNRTKFFDFILPIVPIIDSTTSDIKLISLCKDLIYAPDNDVLSSISLYIDDMRLLKNIVNEYIVYSNIIPLKQLQLDKNKLFALITLKNIFPREFDLLQEDDGYIRSIFDQIDNIKNKLITQYYDDIKKAKEQINVLNNSVDDNKFKAMALLIPSSISAENSNQEGWSILLKNWSMQKEKIYTINTSKDGNFECNYNEFLDKFIFVDENKKQYIENLSMNRDISISEINKNINTLINKIQTLETDSLNQVISFMLPEEIDELFSSDKYSIVNNHYFPLIRFMIVEGLIDETYCYYKGNFDIDNSVILQKNDLIFKKGLLEKNQLNIFLKVENPAELVRRLNDTDYKRFNILNREILEYCIMHKYDSLVLKITSTVDTYNRYNDLNKILRSFTLKTCKTYIEILLKEDINKVKKILDNSKINYIDIHKEILILIWTTKGIKESTLIEFNSYIENVDEIASYLDPNTKGTFFNNIKIAKTKFSDLENCRFDNENLGTIKNMSAYELTIKNVIFLIRNLTNEEFVYGNMLNCLLHKPKLNEIYNYINENFDNFIEQYINCNTNNDLYYNEENILLQILNSDLSLDMKKNYTKNNKICLTDISKINDLKHQHTIIVELLKNDCIKFNRSNIDLYWKTFDSYDKEFILVFNSHINDNNADEILLNNLSLTYTLIKNRDIDEKAFKILLNYIHSQIYEINKELSEEKIELLIKKGLLVISDKNLIDLFKFKYYEALLLVASINENVLVNFMINNNTDEDFTYKLINSNISNKNYNNLLASLGENFKIEKIDLHSKTIKHLLSNNTLSQSNIKYLCNNFDDIKSKEDFIIYLINHDLLYEEYLNNKIISFILTNDYISESTKIKLILNKIDNKCNTEDLATYIKQVDSIKELADVWKNKYPIINNPDKQKLADALIRNEYVKLRKSKNSKRIMINNKK